MLKKKNEKKITTTHLISAMLIFSVTVVSTIAPDEYLMGPSWMCSSVSHPIWHTYERLDETPAALKVSITTWISAFIFCPSDNKKACLLKYHILSVLATKNLVSPCLWLIAVCITKYTIYTRCT
jgi:hypothetical protein